jgi:hypothetical protein
MRRSTVIYLLLFLLMAGAYYYLNNRPKTADLALTLTPEAPVSYLFNSSDGTPTSIHLESKTGQVVELVLNADKAWALTLPIKASADQGSVEAAVSQLTTIQITDRLPNISPKDVGLDAPDYKLTVKFTNNVERIAEIGVTTPTGNGYYVQSNDQIVIVSKSAIDALVGLLTNPPYAETLTPSLIPPTATETPLPPTPELATATNESATPKP